MMILDNIFLLTCASFITAAPFDEEDLDFLNLPDYLDINQRASKLSTNNIRENFLKKKRQRAIIRNLDKYISNNSIRVDEIAHLELTLDWKSAHDMENDFKNLITMQKVKYVYLRDSHWRTWRKIKDPQGKQKIICYKCQSQIHPNCTECASRGVWVIEEGLPPCPYELFSVVNSNELCASNYTQLGDLEEIRSCPSIIKYADLTKSCNNPIVTRWRFVEDYKISERTWSSVICGGREYCEILTLYQIQPEYVIFRIVNTTNSEIIYSRIMQNYKKNYACVNDCGVMDLKTYTVTKNKERNTILNLLPKTKRDSVKKTKKYPKKVLYSDITNNFLTTTAKTKKVIKINKGNHNRYKTPKPKTNVKKKHVKTLKKKKKKNLKTKTLERTNISLYKWVNTANGIYISVVETTTKSHCKKIIEANARKNLEDYYDDDLDRSISLY